MSNENIEFYFFDNRYALFEFDLTKVRSEWEEVDLLKEIGAKARSFEIVQADDVAYIKINSTAATEITAQPGFKLSRFYVERFYVKNPASAISGAKLIILVTWRV